MEKKFVKKMPSGFFIEKDDSVVCEHRDLSCCPKCEAQYENIVEVYGQHYWADTYEDLLELQAIVEAK